MRYAAGGSQRQPDVGLCRDVPERRDGTVGTFTSAACFALGPGQTSVLYLTDAGVLSTSTGGYPTTAHVRLATVVTGAATITSLSDDRVVCSVVGTDALPYLLPAGGSLFDDANLTLGTAR